jgi:hypothetical protein
MSANAAPGIEAIVAAARRTSPARTSTVPARQFDTVPTTLVGIMTAKEVPFATRSLMAKMLMNAGTAMIPPPIPKSADRMPIASPRMTYWAAIKGVRSVGSPRCGDSGRRDDGHAARGGVASYARVEMRQRVKLHTVEPTRRMRRGHRALNVVAALVAVATTMIGGAGAVAQTPAEGREAHSVTIHARETPPTGYPTATPVAEEPEHPIVGLFRGVLIAGMLVAVGVVVAVTTLVRRVRRRRYSR